jgi:NAD(P)-dependent dehydrogenase (short-subunit alcohol dehydrogenase family)
MNSRIFEGRTALVTGAGRGIGRAIAIGLAAGGARVALLARSANQLNQVADAIRTHSSTALVLVADVGNQDSVNAAAAEALSEFGAVDILVNNAAVVRPLGPTLSVSADEWAAAFAINVIGPFQLSRALLPSMIKRRWGRIANVSSGIVAFPAMMTGMNAYAASKSALEAHTLNLAGELADTGVAVNVYRPGSVDTAMQAWIRSQPAEEIGAALHSRFVQTYQSGNLLTPEQSAASLLSRLTSDATGEVWSASDR